MPGMEANLSAEQAAVSLRLRRVAEKAVRLGLPKGAVAAKGLENANRT
jgi:hypothetical protein